MTDYFSAFQMISFCYNPLLLLHLLMVSQAVTVPQCPPALQRCQLCFSRMLLVSRPCSQAGRHCLCWYFSRHLLLFSIFPLINRLLLWLFALRKKCAFLREVLNLQCDLVQPALNPEAGCETSLRNFYLCYNRT